MNELDSSRGTKQFVIIDRETKRETEAYGLVVPRYAPHPYRKDGAQIAQSALRDLAVNRNLTKRALRIALWLISRVERTGGVYARRAEIAEDLNMHKSDVSRGLRELYKHGTVADRDGVVYQPILPPGQKPVVGVRPSVAWKGASKDLVDAIMIEKRHEASVPGRRERTPDT